MKACIDDSYRKNLILPYNLQWFADGEGGEKTEPATQKKLEDARKEGKVARSKDLTQGIDLLVLFLLLKIFVGYMGERFMGLFDSTLGRMAEFMAVRFFNLSFKTTVPCRIITMFKYFLQSRPDTRIISKYSS